MTFFDPMVRSFTEYFKSCAILIFQVKTRHSCTDDGCVTLKTIEFVLAFRLDHPSLLFIFHINYFSSFCFKASSKRFS